jgi:hypothetical protein
MTMGCGCQKAAKEFIYVDEKGQQHTHDTLVSAKAAKIRNGNVGAIREQAKTK